MKRGFLLRPEERIAAANRRVSQKQIEPSPPTATVSGSCPNPQPPKRADNPEVKALPFGNLTDEEKALPSDYDFNESKFICKELDPMRTQYNENLTLITSVPQPVPDDEIECEWIVNGSTKAKVFNAPGYPARIPKPRRPDLYQILPTPNMGQGLFAKHDLKRGDLILAERPLIVAPRALLRLTGNLPEHYTLQQTMQISKTEFEYFLRAAFDRLPPESQADFKALHNAHTGDGSGPLFGIMRTNSYSTGIYDGSNEKLSYGAICKIASRINHSCIPNVRESFKLNSFSMQFYARRDIKAGEQLFFSYCRPGGGVAKRRAELAPYGFQCECSACTNATPETDNLRNTFEAQITAFKDVSMASGEIDLEAALRLEKEMVKEGLDGYNAFVVLITAICIGYTKLGKWRESETYRLLVDEFQCNAQD